MYEVIDIGGFIAVMTEPELLKRFVRFGSDVDVTYFNDGRDILISFKEGVYVASLMKEEENEYY